MIAPAEAAAEMLARQRARRSLADYIAYAQMGIVPAAHHRLLIDRLERVERGEIPRMMVCMPPGSAKSTYASIVYPAWYLGRNPERSIVAASHTAELAERFGRRVRNLVGAPAHLAAFGCGVSADSHAAGRWETARGGEYYAVGVGGSVTGRRADLGLIDDPVRGREDADSERSRNGLWDWYVNDFVPRLKPGAAQVVIMTRWHEDDLAGRILERERAQWDLVEIPMEAMPDDPLGRAVGERLWPEWYTPQQVEDAKLDVRAWNALYQQQPAGESGDYFRAEWLVDYDRLPDRLAIYGASDYAVTEGGGDYTEHGIFGVDHQGNVYVLDWWRGQTAADKWIEALCDLIVRHQPLRWFGEAGPIRRAVEPYLIRRMEERQAYCRIEWLPSIADKPTRCRPFQALCSMGKARFPVAAPWKADLIGQLLRFPAGRHDDGVDVCSLFGRGLEHVKAPRIRRETVAPRVMVPLSAGGGNDWLGL